MARFEQLWFFCVVKKIDFSLKRENYNLLQITLFWNTFVFDFQCYLHNISRLKSYHRGLVCCISTDQWEYSISKVRISELIKMRNVKIFSQSESGRRKASMKMGFKTFNSKLNGKVFLGNILGVFWSESTKQWQRRSWTVVCLRLWHQRRCVLEHQLDAGLSQTSPTNIRNPPRRWGRAGHPEDY